MNGSNLNSGIHDEATPVELRAVETALDRLGECERASAPSGFEARLFDSTRAALCKPPGVIARIGGSGGGVSVWRFRLAAAIVIAAAGVLAAVWVRSGGAERAGPAEIASETTGGWETITAEELAAQIRADLVAWAADTSALSLRDNELVSLHTRLNEIESGAYSVDPWDDVEDSNWEPSL